MPGATENNNRKCQKERRALNNNSPRCAYTHTYIHTSICKVASRQFSHDKSLKEYEKARIVTEIIRRHGYIYTYMYMYMWAAVRVCVCMRLTCFSPVLLFMQKSYAKLALRTCQRISWSGNLIQAAAFVAHCISSIQNMLPSQPVPQLHIHEYLHMCVCVCTGSIHLLFVFELALTCKFSQINH